ncbi:MAG: hypothetical protein AB9834_11550 [Lentimicrobium sp.]
MPFSESFRKAFSDQDQMDFTQSIVPVKNLLFVVAFLLPAVTFSQSLSGGVSAGFIPPVFGEMLPFGGINLEYSFRNSDLSINTGFDVYAAKDESFISVPLYVKASTAGRFRFCPFAGGFVNSDDRFGWLLGAGIEYGQRNKINLFLQGEILIGYSKELQTEVAGIQDYYWSKYAISQMRIGIKKNILRARIK